jgi:xanthine dehydrogenase YagR molybdenum-binding subunit
VVAETFEQARAAAQLVRVDYERSRGFDLAAAEAGKRRANGSRPTFRRRRLRRRLRRGAGQARRHYTTPDQSHAMMEPHATIAAWDGDQLTVWTSNQMIAWGVGDVAKTLGIPKDEGAADLALHRRRLRRQAVRAHRRAAGGAGRAAARRPVKVALQRPLIANNTTHRPATIQRIRIGATPRRQDHRHRARELVGRPARRQARERGAADPLLYAGANRMTATAWRCSTCRKATPCARRARRPA